MSSIAIITARGGSKRIPRKNIKEFLGKPIIAYSIEAALESGVFDEVMVSTDDVEIAEISKKYGAKVPFFRSEATSNDFATTADVLAEVIETYKGNGRLFDIVCCIYPTAPFLTEKKLREAFEIIKKDNVDSVIPVTEFSFAPLRGMIIDNGQLKYKWPEYAQVRSQDLEKMYHDAGQFYMFKIGSFKENKRMVSGNTSAIVIPETEVQDIDTFEDWEIAEIKYTNNKKKEE